MGNGKSSGIKQIKRLTSITNNISSDNSKWLEWQNKTVEEASILYGKLFSQMPSNELRDAGLNDNGLQRIVLAMNLAGPGRTVADADFDAAVKEAALNGVVLYRGSSKVAIDNLVNGDVGYIGDGIHGDGIYFSTRFGTARSYGGTRVTAFIDKGLANVVSEDKLYRMLHNESYDVQKQFYGDSGFSSYALYKGYNVIHVPGGNGSRSHRAGGEDFYVPLTRGVLVFREHTK